MLKSSHIIAISIVSNLTVASAPAQAGVAAEWGGLVNVLLNSSGLRCGQVANVIEGLDEDWECSLVTTENTYRTLGQCMPALEDGCVQVSTDLDGDGFTCGSSSCY